MESTAATRQPPAQSLNRLAIGATTHCLTGCATGEFTGFVIAYPFAFLANRYMIARGKGHALVHEHHGQ